MFSHQRRGDVEDACTGWWWKKEIGSLGVSCLGRSLSVSSEEGYLSILQPASLIESAPKKIGGVGWLVGRSVVTAGSEW